MLYNGLKFLHPFCFCPSCYISRHTRGPRVSTAKMSTNYVVPGQARHLRACMVCSIVQLQSVCLVLQSSLLIILADKHPQRFLRDGCPNCESFLDLAGHQDSVQECTSQVYEGLITLADPSSSWVARWQRLDKYVPGVYATKVVGILPDEVLQAMEDSGIRYVPRDGSAGDDEV